MNYTNSDYQNSNNQDDNYNSIRKYVLNNSGSYCPICGFKKRLEDLKLIKVTNNLYNFISTCPNCGLKNLITFTPNLGFQMTQLKADISIEEFGNFTSPVSSDDYLSFYNKMKKVKTVQDLLSLIKN